MRLDNGHEAEIDLRNPHERRVAAFSNGKLVDRTISSRDTSMTIIGGNRDGESV